MHVGNSEPTGRTQASRSARTRAALLESAARGLSRHGYGNLVLEQVAKEAGYTRGALYHQFKDKQELTLAVLDWVLGAWQDEVGVHVERETQPVEALLTLARRHAVFCRREFARVAFAIRLEFTGQDHPIGRAIELAYAILTRTCRELIETARDMGVLPDGPPADVHATAFVGAVEGVTIALAGREPHDERLVERAAAGVLGVEIPDPYTEATR
ncbi:MAG TPA: TetR/AcrR family transcriptional regulator [Phytomonospora sp.]